MGCRCAPALKKALDDATKRWPKRVRASDGCCGDEAHRKRKSDHNPDVSGYAHAADITHDPKNGVDCNEIAAQLIGLKDSRVKYLIWNARIWFPSEGARPGGWSAYTGPNEHRHHIHISIKANAHHDLSPWPWSGAVEESDSPSLDTAPLPPPFPGKVVEPLEAIKAFQKFKGLDVDGKVGPATWAELFK